MSNLVKYDTEKGPVELSPEIVRKYLVAPDARVSDQEIEMFLRLCLYQKLNPFLREAYLVKYGTQPASIVVGWHVFLKRAENNPQFDGYEVEVFDGTDVPYRRQGNQDIAYATAKIYRKDRSHPIVVTVLFDEYCKTDRDGNPVMAWRQMPATMIRKVALEQGLRESFTKDFEGMYGPEEMGITDTLPEKPVAQPAPVPVEDRAPDEELEALDTKRDVVWEPPSKPLVAPFAVIKHLTDLFGPAWSKAKVHDTSVTMHYFGTEMKNAQDMALFAKNKPDEWIKGCTKLVADTKLKGKAPRVS